jgi:hypothetical protein
MEDESAKHERPRLKQEANMQAAGGNAGNIAAQQPQNVHLATTKGSPSGISALVDKETSKRGVRGRRESLEIRLTIWTTCQWALIMSLKRGK